MKKIFFITAVVAFLSTSIYPQDSKLDSIWREVFSNKEIERDPIEGFWSMTRSSIKSKNGEIINLETDENIAKLLIFGMTTKNEFMVSIIEGEKSEFTLMDIIRTGSKNRYICKLYNHGYRGHDYSANILLKDNTITFTIKLNDKDLRTVYTHFWAENRDNLSKKFSIDDFVKGLTWEFKYTLYKTYPID